jgi:hypothetical protein
MEVSAFAIISIFSIREKHLPSYDRSYLDSQAFMADMDSTFGIWRAPNKVSRVTRSCFDVEYKSNSVGARDSEFDTADSKHRIFMLGDSYLEGYGVDYGERISELIENDTTEVYNMAISGHFGPTQYLLLYEKYKNKLPHDEIFVGLNLPNDLTDQNIENWKGRRRYRPYLNISEDSFQIDYGTVPLNKSIYSTQKRKGTVIKNILNEYSFLYHLHLKFKSVSEFNSELINKVEAIDYFENELNEVKFILKYLKRSTSKKITVFIVPNKKVIIDCCNQYIKELENFAEANQINIINLNERLKKYNTEDWFFRCDVHWSVKGNFEIAKMVKEHYNN